MAVTLQSVAIISDQGVVLNLRDAAGSNTGAGTPMIIAVDHDARQPADAVMGSFTLP